MSRVLIVVALMLLAGCHGGPGGGDAVRVGFKQSGSSVHLAPGKNLVVLLTSNPTTGYSWSLTAMDTNVLAKVGNVYKPHSQDPLIIGEGGHEEWRFMAIAPGKSLLKLVYARKWETGKPQDSFELTVYVDQPK